MTLYNNFWLKRGVGLFFRWAYFWEITVDCRLKSLVVMQGSHWYMFRPSVTSPSYQTLLMFTFGSVSTINYKT